MIYSDITSLLFGKPGHVKIKCHTNIPLIGCAHIHIIDVFISP